MSDPSNPALKGNTLSAYLHFAVPSVVGLLAWSAAPIIDGLFIANYLGVLALASVNLIIPVFTMAFGITYMISSGGSVRAGKYIGERNKEAASNIFSKTLIVGVIYSLLFVLLGAVGSEGLFALLGASPALLSCCEKWCAFGQKRTLLIPRIRHRKASAFDPKRTIFRSNSTTARGNSFCGRGFGGRTDQQTPAIFFGSLADRISDSRHRTFVCLRSGARPVS